MRSERFQRGRRALDELEPDSDLWERAQERAAGVEESSPSAPTATRQMPLVAAVAALVVLVVGATFLWADRSGDEQLETGGSDQETLLGVVQFSDVEHAARRTVECIDAAGYNATEPEYDTDLRSFTFGVESPDIAAAGAIRQCINEHYQPVSDLWLGATNQREQEREQAVEEAVLRCLAAAGFDVEGLTAEAVDRLEAEAPGVREDCLAEALRDGTSDSPPTTPAEAVSPSGADVPPLPDGDAPSQSPQDAVRDGVHAEVAALSDADRSQRLAAVGAAEGYWTLSRTPSDRSGITNNTGPLQVGDPAGRYGIEWINLGEYGEILLLDESGRIQRAFPMPGLVPTWIHVAERYVYAGRVGDGGLPASSVVRIDRSNLDADVVVFPTAEHRTLPDLGWHTAPDGTSFSDLVTVGATGTVVESWTGPVSVDTDAIDELLQAIQ